MTEQRDRSGNWKRDEWVGNQSTDTTTARPATETGEPATTDDQPDSWVKTEWVGDQGEGMPAPVDPRTMEEGDTSISGRRHGQESAHWADPAATRQADVDALQGDRPLDEPS